MDDNIPLGKKIFYWLISPGVLKLTAFVVAISLTISFLSRLKAEQIAARTFTTPHFGWTHGTSDLRLQTAIDHDDAAEVKSLLGLVHREQIRPTIIDRLAFDKTSHALDAFLSSGWDPDGFRHAGQPVINAVRSGQAKALAVLLRHGANPNVRDEAQRSSMLWASGVYRSGPELIRLLASHGAQVDVVSTYKTRTSLGQKVAHVANNRPITMAAFTGNIEGIKILLKMGARPDLVPGEDLPPIAAAAFARRSYETTRLLLEGGANPNGEGIAYLDGPDGLTIRIRANALFLNSWFDHTDTVKLLLEHGADPNRRTSTGRSAADVAAPQTLAVLTQTATQSKRQKSTVQFR